MINIVICDDDANELLHTKQLCQSYAYNHKEPELRIECYSSGVELHQRIVNGQCSIDVLLLDIYMPGMTGIELARSLREREDHCQIVFLTTSMAHAIEAFSLHAAHYLLKPFTKDQLEDALDRALAIVEKGKKANILLKTATGLQKVNTADVLYCETDKHNQNIFLLEGKWIQVRITCSELFELLSSDRRFYKCGSTYILNLDKITEITAKHILFANGAELPMQRRQYKELLELYTRYLLEE